jgi:hypothetical protein
MHLDKKPIADNEFDYQYFLMGIDQGDVNILRSALHLLIENLTNKPNLAPEEMALYRKIVRLNDTIHSD